MNTQRIIKNSFGLGLAIALSVVFEAFTHLNYNSNVYLTNSDTTEYNSQDEDSSIICFHFDSYEAFNIPEGYPTFPNGTDALKKFIYENTQYPDSAKDKSIEGLIVVEFVVNESGSIEDVSVWNKNFDPYLAAEAIRVVKKMPKWIPGSKKKGNVKYYIPFNFSLH